MNRCWLFGDDTYCLLAMLSPKKPPSPRMICRDKIQFDRSTNSNQTFSGIPNQKMIHPFGHDLHKNVSQKAR